MTLVYMDTNVVDVFLRNNIQSLLLFRSLKKAQRVQFLCSLDLLIELSNNPNVEAAKSLLKIINHLCSRYFFTLEPKTLFQEDFVSFFERKPRNPFFSRTDANNIFEHKFWDNMIAGKLGVIQSWFKERNKQRFLEEKQEYYEERKMLSDIQLNSPATFADIWTAAKSVGFNNTYMTEMVRRQCQRTPLPEEIAAILDNLEKLPVVRCCLLHHLAYFLFFIIKKKQPTKRGNNMDARHIMAAANSDIFITDDRELLGLLKSADNHWPFIPMTSEHFCQKFND